MRPRLTFRQWVGYAGFAFILLLTVAIAIYHGDIIRAGLNPEVPFQTYDPPSEPNYSEPKAWALWDARIDASGDANVFFVHPTTFDGGDDWIGAIDDADADAYLRRAVLPNYAAPFARAGAVSAPHYRQASLFARLTPRDDAREARAFAYQDVEAAFDLWLRRHPTGPVLLAGVEQGADLLDLLLRRRIAGDPALRDRLVAAYLMETLIPLDQVDPRVPVCANRRQLHCLVAWSQVEENDQANAFRRLHRTLVWDEKGRLVALGDRQPVCVNPMTGSADPSPAPARMHRGAANATGLEWTARPALIARQISAGCRDGLLRHNVPHMESFRDRGNWAERRKVPPYNLFYGDLEADAAARLSAYHER